MKAPLKLGDRVAAYTGQYGRRTGKVVNERLLDGSCNVLLDDGTTVVNFHPKQLRRLVKKEKPKLREFWIPKDPKLWEATMRLRGIGWLEIVPHDEESKKDFIHAREVRRKK